MYIYIFRVVVVVVAAAYPMPAREGLACHPLGMNASFVSTVYGRGATPLLYRYQWSYNPYKWPYKCYGPLRNW